MAKPTNCTIKGIQEQEAQEHINRKVSEIEIEVDTILDHHFGRVFDRTTSLNNTINAKNKSIRDKQARLQYVIKNKTPNFRKESRVLKDKIKQELWRTACLEYRCARYCRRIKTIFSK